MPELFSTGIISPAIKKRKPSNQCSSIRPIILSPVLCKISELMIIDETTMKFYTPDNQPGFRKGVDRNQANNLITNLLVYSLLFVTTRLFKVIKHLSVKR